MSTPSASHSPHLRAHLVDRADEPADPERREVDTVEHARRRAARAAGRSAVRDRARPRRTARRARACATSSPDRDRSARTRRRAPAAVRGTRRASTPSTCSNRRRGAPRAAAAGRPCRRRTRAAAAAARAPGRLVRVERAVVRAVVGERTTAEQTLHDLERVDEPVEPLARARHLHAERLVLGLVPARAEPDVEPAAAHAVERRQRLGQHRRRPQRLEQHERPEPHAGNERARAPRA